MFSDALTPIAELGDGGGYDYSLLGAFKHEGKVYICHTSGCSCTSPYDEYNSFDDMISISAKGHVLVIVSGLLSTNYMEKSVTAEEKVAFVNKIKDAVEGT